MAFIPEQFNILCSMDINLDIKVIFEFNGQRKGNIHDG